MRRRKLRLNLDVLEIKLDDEFPMSSLFTASEIGLARLGVDALSGAGRDIVVGNLGLGYTANTVLPPAGVSSLLVMEMLDAVIDWHCEGLLPLGNSLTTDPRWRFVHGNFLALAATGEGFDSEAPGRCFDSILVDIGPSPEGTD